MLRKVVLLIICLALLHSDGFAEEKIKIAVMDLDAKNVPKATAFAVSDLLRNDLYASKKYTIVERSQMEKILKEQMFQQTGCVSTECAVEVGKILNATQMIVGSISTLGLEYSITIRVVDVETTETKFSATLSCKYEAEFKNVSKALISNLTGVEVRKLEEEKIRIAVMDLEAKNVPKVTASAISDLLRNDLYSSNTYIIVEKSQMEKILKEQMFQQTGCTSTECAVEIGKILNATQMIVGSISMQKIEYNITVKVVDVETGETRFTETAVCKLEAEFKKVSQAIISKLTGVGVSTLLTEENTSFDVAKYSAMFPGWGQFNNGQELKGCLIAFAEIAALSGAIYTYVQYNKAVEVYDAAPIGSDFPVLVKTIQDLSNLNKVYLWSALGIWVYGVIDPYLFGINKDRKFTLDYNNDKFKLAYSIKF